MWEIAVRVAAIVIDVTLKIFGWRRIGGRFIAGVRLGLIRNVVRVRERRFLVPIPITGDEPPPTTPAVIAAMVPTPLIPDGPMGGIETWPFMTSELVDGCRWP
jgi:hypothetical protein